VTLALGTRLASSGSGGNVTPVDPPVERRALVTEDAQPLTLELITDYIVISDGTFESIVIEDGSTFLTQEDLGKLILTVN
jgi:hypothetical protein